MKNNILIVEDDTLIAELIEDKVNSLGFNVIDSVTNYDEAIESILNKQPNAILIDIHLDGKKDGIDLAKKIDKEFHIPYIFLTSDNSEETILKTSQTKQISYLDKNVCMGVLKANLLIALSKNKKNNLTKIDNGYFYDEEAQIVFHNNHPIKISKNEAMVLELLISNKNHLITSTTIINYVWHDKPPTAKSAVRELMRGLRKKLPNLNIKNIRGVGYKLESN